MYILTRLLIHHIVPIDTCYTYKMGSIERKTSNFIHVNPETSSADMDIPLIQGTGQQTSHYWLYVLHLEDDTYYIGYTKLPNPYDRILQHGTESGAKWLIKHKPLEVSEIRDLGVISENEAKRYGEKLRLAYMQVYGYKRIAMKSYFLHSSYRSKY